MAGRRCSSSRSTAAGSTSRTRSIPPGTTSSTPNFARGSCASTATRKVGWRSTQTSSPTSTRGRAARPARTRCACPAAIARRRSSSDPRAPRRRARRSVCHRGGGRRGARVARGVPCAATRLRGPVARAGVNRGLVHYYFGSNENLLVRTLERFTERLIERQRELYAADVPFVEKWRTAMRYLVGEDLTYEKVWLELQALGWNNADVRERLAGVNAEWRAVLTEALDGPRRDAGIEMPLDALVSLVMTFNIGIIVERLGGIDAGHDELLAWIDGWLSS